MCENLYKGTSFPLYSIQQMECPAHRSLFKRFGICCTVFGSIILFESASLCFSGVSIVNSYCFTEFNLVNEGGVVA